MPIYSTKAVLLRVNPEHLALLQSMTGEQRKPEVGFVGFNTRASEAERKRPRGRQ